MSTSALSSVVNHTVVLPEVTGPQLISTSKPTLTLGLVPALAPYLGTVPNSEPPFDDEGRPPHVRTLTAALPATPRHSEVRHHELTVISAPRGLVSTTACPTQVLDPTVPGWSYEADSGITRTAALNLPPARGASQMLARAVVEVISGYRQLSQLRIHCAAEVFAGIQQHIRVAGPPPRLMSVRVTEPADGVVEASAVFRRRHRAAAMAFRLQGIDGRWRITALQIG